MLYLIKNKIFTLFLLSVFSFQQIAFSAADTIKIPQVSIHQDLNIINNIKIDRDLAQIENISISENNENETIINIQDCHASLSSQYSIVNILENLMNNYDMNVVAVEGGTGYIDTSILKSYPDKSIRENTAKYLMSKSYISAGEFFAVTKDEDVAIYGVENDELYLKNVNLFRKIYEDSEDNIAMIGDLTGRMIKKETDIYNEDLQQVVYKSRLHRSGKLSLNVYWQFLEQIAQENNISLQEYHNIRSFMEIVNLEKQIDFNKVTVERKQVLSVLVDRLQGEKLKQLVKRTVDFEENKISKPDYYSSLLKTAKQLDVNIDEYTELCKYSNYVASYWELNIIGIQAELQGAEELITSSLFESKTQEEFYEFQVFLERLKDLYVIKLSAKEVSFISEKIIEIKNSDFVEFLIRYGIVQEGDMRFTSKVLSGIFESAKKYMKFYDIASKRNNALLSNTVKAMKKEGKTVAALITGGYHSQGLTDMMKKKGFSYLVLMPKTFEDQERPYVAVLTKKAQTIREIAKSGEYSLALEVGLSKNEKHFKEMLAFIIGQNLLKGQEVGPEIEKWISLIKNLRSKLSNNRLESMELVPMDLDKLQKWLKNINYEKISWPNKSFKIKIEKDIYIVTENGLTVLDGERQKETESLELDGLLERIREFGKVFDSIILSENINNAILKAPVGITKTMLLVWQIFWEVSQNIYGAIASRAAKKKVKVVLLNLFNPEGRHLTLGFPLSVESMAGDLRNKYGDKVDVEIIDMQQGINVDEVIQKIKREKIDIFGLSVKTGEQSIAKNILDKIYSDKFPENKIPSKIVVGGHRPRVYSDEFLKEYDDIFVCQGEGEPTMRGLVELSLGKRKSINDVPNLKYIDNTNELVSRPKETQWEELDFSEYAIPSVDTLNSVNQAGGIVYWETSRGCTWGKCNFCNRFFCRHTTPRVVSVEKIVEGLEALSQKGAEHVFFADTDFLQNDTARMKRLSKAIIVKKENGRISEELNFWIQTRAAGIYVNPNKSGGGKNQKIVDENDNKYEALKLLQKAGLRKIFLGIETGSASQLQRYNKGSDIDTISGAIGICRKLDIQIEGGLIPIGPFIELEELKDTVSFVEGTETSDSIVKVLNLLCVEEKTEYYKMVSGGLPEKGYDENLITGSRDEDTLLFPWKMKNPDLEIIKKTATEWMEENGHFIYALRRIVDATEIKSSAEHNLRYFRRIDFALLKGLVQICSIEASDNRKQQREELEEFKELSLMDRKSVDDLAAYIEERIIKEENKESMRRARDFSVGKLVEMIRSARDRGLEIVEEDIRKGEIKGPTEFLELGIKRIRKEIKKIPRLLSAQEKFQIVLGIPEHIYNKIGEREIRRLRAGIDCISDIIRLDYNLQPGEELDEINEKGKMRRLLESLQAKTTGRRCISAILDVEDVEGDIEEIIRGFVQRTGRDVPKYTDPAVSLTEQDVLNIDKITSFGKENIKNILIRRHPHEESIHLDRKSLYDLRIDEIRESLKEREYSVKVKNYLSEADEEIKDNRQFVVTTVDEILDVKLLAGSLRERKEQMYGRKDAGTDLIKDFIVIKNENITNINKDEILEKTGIYDYILPEQIIVLDKNEILGVRDLKERLDRITEQQWGISNLSWKNVAIAEKAKILDIDQKDLPDFLRENNSDNLLYVKLGKVDNEIAGVVSQLYKMTLEIMAHKDRAKHISNAELKTEKGYLYFIYIPKARAFDYNAEVVSYESYVLRSL